MFGAGGFIGMPHFCDLSFLNNGLPTEGFLIFQTVFCATAATIVSERWQNVQNSPCISSTPSLSSVLIYPISGHWTWGGGWLMNGEEGSFMMSHFGTTFHDFAGSTVVHSVGGWIALVGAAILGPRIGKYGKDGKSKAIPDHAPTIAALGYSFFGSDGSDSTPVLNWQQQPKPTQPLFPTYSRQRTWLLVPVVSLLCW